MNFWKDRDICRWEEEKFHQRTGVCKKTLNGNSTLNKIKTKLRKQKLGKTAEWKQLKNIHDLENRLVKNIHTK